MSITVTARGSSSNAASATETNVLSSTTLSANSKVVVFAFCQEDSAVAATIATTMTGWTTSLAQTGHATTAISFAPHIYVYEGVMGASPGAGTITIDWATSTGAAYGCAFSIDLTGTIAIPTLKQAQPTPVTAGKGETDSETGVSPTLGASATSGNTCIVAFGAGAGGAGAAATPSGWTAVGTPQTANYATLGVFKRTDFTGTSVTCTDLGQGVGSYGSAIFEFEEVGGGGGTSAMQYVRRPRNLIFRGTR